MTDTSAISDLPPGAWVAGSDAPERQEIRVGFMPLTDCASVVMAAECGFDRRFGIRIRPIKEASWASVRDKLIGGELDAAHILYGLVYGLQMGIGGPRQDMAVLMGLNQNGQGITLSNQLREQGVVDGQTLARLVAARDRESTGRDFTFAQTFPTGTHALWLYYWLAAHGVHPFRDVRTITVPPPQMVANMRAGNMDGYCAGEPWNNRAILDNIGFSVATSQDIWPDHPEKVLGATASWVARHPNTARALVAALLEASRWIDASPVNRQKTAETIAARAYVNTDVDAIVGRMLGRYQNGLGRRWEDAHPMKFFDEGRVNYPYLSDGMWFLTQHRRWGLLGEHPDYLDVARRVNRLDVYSAAAQAVGVSLPAGDGMRSSLLMDGGRWDGSDPRGYADAFSLKA